MLWINLRRGGGMLLIALATIGCAGSRPALEPPSPRALGANVPRSALTGAERGVEVRASVPIEPEGELTLEGALTLALSHNPSLTVHAWELSAREAEARHSGPRPNPELDAEIENVGGTRSHAGFGSGESTFGVRQLLELGGKRGARQRLAAREHDVAAWDAESARLDVFTSTSTAFVRVLVAQERIALADDLVRLAERVEASVERRVAAGAVSPVEASRARVELESARIERAEIGAALRTARRNLSASWGARAATFDRAVGSLEPIAEPPSLETLRAHLESNPDLARWASERARRDAALALERSRGVPDLALGIGARRLGENDESAFLLGMSAPLPLFDRNRAAVRAAELRAGKAGAERAADALRVENALAAALEALEAAVHTERALGERAIPSAQTAYRTAEEAYRRGPIRFTDVLDTQRLLFELERRRLESIERQHLARAEIERLLGRPLESLTETGRP